MEAETDIPDSYLTFKVALHSSSDFAHLFDLFCALYLMYD